MIKKKNIEPGATIVIFGAKGDLAWRKLFPAFYHLYINDQLPQDFQIIGVHYAAMQEQVFKKHLYDGLESFSRSGKPQKSKWNAFARHITYFQGDFTDDGMYASLHQLIKEKQGNGPRGTRLYFYAVAPQFIEVISTGLHHEKMAVEKDKDRIVVEKPFGTDLHSARKLNAMLTKYFDENQVYRIDHFLGKEPVQNILTLRFANSVFEALWNHNYINNIQITVAEEKGIEGRGGFYDQTGALRDMIQNHLLQLLCVVAMEPPVSFNAEEIRNKKADVLKAIRRYDVDAVSQHVVRGQYSGGMVDGKKLKGYRDEDKVAASSSTETFVAARFFIDNWRWQGVPFFLRTGKAMKKAASVIVIEFNEIPHGFLPRSVNGNIEPNRLIISIQPQMEITLLFQAKVPGMQLRICPAEMDFIYAENYSQGIPEAYETLMSDALKGDATLFMRADQVEEAWDVIMPVLKAWEKEKPADFPNYKAGSWGPDCAAELIKQQGLKWVLLPEEKKLKKHKARKS